MQTKKRDNLDILFTLLKFSWITAEEIILGIRKSMVPISYCLPGALIALAIYFRIDSYLASTFLEKFRIPFEFRSPAIYSSVISGWIYWGISRAYQRIKLLRKLKSALEAADLRCNGRFPAIIEDVMVDHRVRKIRLHSNGVTKSKFESGIEQLEAILNMCVIRLVQGDDKSKIEILYTMKDLEHNVVLENPEQYSDGEIPIGVTFDGSLAVNIRDVGHILVAGQTGGGKSNFLKVVTTVLAKNNPNARIVFMDFKGGMESADIKNHALNLEGHIDCYEGTKSCIEELGRIGTGLEERFKTLSKIGASTFDDYLEKKDKQVVDTKEIVRSSNEKRTYVIIDEIAQLYSREPGIEKDKLVSARSTVNRIARQGRAAGVHLIVATQKPDSTSFDQTVKSNLPAILCFPMPNQVSSVSAIGTKRAYEINPNIKGRAVWKFGPKVEEVQTYYFG